MHPLLEELHQYHRNISVTIHQLQTLLDQAKQENSEQTDCDSIFKLLNHLHGEAEVKHHKNEEVIRRQLMNTDAPIHQRVNDIAHVHLGFARITEQLCNLEASGRSVKEVCLFIEDYFNKYFDHMQGEETIFFPMADKWLTDFQWQEVQKIWQK